MVYSIAKMALQASVLSQCFQIQHQTPLLLSLLFLSLCFLLWLSRSPAKKTNSEPPSPPRFPLIGHFHHLGSLPHRSLQLLSKEYGPLMLLHFGQTPYLLVSSAEMAKQILKTHDITFSNRSDTTASRTFIYGSKDIVYAPYGEYWRQIRKHCVTELLSVGKVKSFSVVREEEVAYMVDKIRESSLRGKEVNLSDLIISVTNNIVTRAALGRRFEGESGKTECAVLIEKTMELFGFPSVEDMFPSLAWIDVLTGLRKRMNKTSKAMHKFYDEVIEEHLVARSKGGAKTAAAKDFMELLLDFEQDSSLGVPFTRENLKAVIMDIFLAGTETTSTSLQWAMAELLSNPNTLKQVQEEVRRVVGLGTKAKVDENDIHQMQYLNCVIKETFRLHPPIVIVHRSASSANGATIGGYDIPANRRVMINAWAIARDPKVWDRPNEFIPERFVNNVIDFRGQDFEFLPFGAGRRACPGISFGTSSVEFTLASLLYWFDWVLPEGGDINLTESFGLSVPMKYPLRLVPVSFNI